MARPNLFDQGTSELTQDAALCWLLAWADHRCATDDPGLHMAGRGLVRALLSTHGLQEPEERYEVRVERQEARVDVVARIGSAYVLGIEDKTESGIHGNQLATYRNYLAALAQKEGRTAVPVYVKSGEVAEGAAVRAAGWQVFGRAQLAAVLDEAVVRGCRNDVLLEYRAWLARREELAAAWRVLPANGGWWGQTWQGLYSELASRMTWARHLDWGYVANPREGFQALWWGFHPVGSVEIYLQLQQEALAVRVKMKAAGDRTHLARHWRERILATGRHLGFVQPSRLRPGESMAVALLPNWRVGGGEGRLDLPATLDRLRMLDGWVQALAADAVPSPVGSAGNPGQAAAAAGRDG